MRRPGRTRRAVALMLAAAITLVAAPPPVPARTDEPEGGVIRGSLVDASGRPLVGYRVSVKGSSGNVYQSEPTGPDGKFEISELPPDTYSYLITDPDERSVAVRIAPVTLEAGNMITQPIAIVPRKKGHGPLIAWLVGGGAAAAALALAGGNDDDDDGDEPPMTASGSGGG